jgi:hypothetical protein
MHNTKVNYIIGIGRSGTSLLVSLLGSQSNIRTIPENYFSVFFAYYFAQSTTFTIDHIRLINTFNEHFNRLQPYIGYSYVLDDELIENGFYGDYLSLCKKIYGSFHHSTINNVNATVIIDKNPSNTLFLDTLKSINPKGKYLLMMRDYRANILSRKESVHLLSPNVVYNAMRWNYFTKKAIRFQKKHKEKVLVVKYEDLVVRPADELQRILDFFELNLESNLASRDEESLSYTEYQNDEKLARNERIIKKYGDLAQPIFTSRINAWQERLSEKEIELCELYCSKAGSSFGYQPSRTKASLGKRIFVHLRYLPIYLKVRFTFFKDTVFYYLPIRFKVSRFVKYVNKVDQFRQKASV